MRLLLVEDDPMIGESVPQGLRQDGFAVDWARDGKDAELALSSERYALLLSVSGVFLGLWLTGTELNISAMMGMTMIVGIVTEIAIFHFAELEPAGTADPGELICAGRMRMRPIIMTSVIAILALLPLALGIGTGAAMQTPLAIAIISGLLIALPLVLIFLPALYLVLQKVFSGARGKVREEQPREARLPSPFPATPQLSVAGAFGAPDSFNEGVGGGRGWKSSTRGAERGSMEPMGSRTGGGRRGPGMAE
jgi:hypothetical protein